MEQLISVRSLFKETVLAVYMIYHATRELKCARTEEEK